MITIDVDDLELFDFVEDYLIEECDIEYEYMQELSIDGSQIYRMYFGNKYTFNEIENQKKKLDKEEINKIYKINNP